MNNTLQLMVMTGYRKWRILPFFLLFLGFHGQAQEVQSSIDTATIKIGEKISYNLEVEADSSSTIIWPHGQTFMPLEVFDTTAIDTFLNKNKIKLKREYALTRFDSGSYTIPRQKIRIDGRAFYTDSFPVRINSVIVDTLKQKLYPIKPALDIKAPFSIAHWVWWIIGGLIVLALLIFIFLKARKKIIKKKQKLPPYEQAIQRLRDLDESKQLENGKVKEYYSSLSEAIKRYVDEKIDERALESTTSEFITLLKSYKNERKIYLKEQVIDSLESILNRADLAKFAGIKTDKLTAREDRQRIENNINAFDQAIPEPTEEELLLDEAYRAAIEKKRRRRKRIIAVGIGVLVVLIAVSTFIGFKGLNYTKELVFSHPTKKLLHHKEWITSEYGTLGITLTTPKVLIREMDSVQKLFPGKTKFEERFSYGSLTGNFYTQVTNVRFKKSAQIDSLNVGDLLDKKMDSDVITNVTFKHTDFTTLQDEKGQKVFGTFNIENPVTKSKEKKTYTFLLFNERGGLQELLISYDQGDESGEKLEKRIVNSVEFNTQHND